MTCLGPHERVAAVCGKCGKHESGVHIVNETKGSIAGMAFLCGACCGGCNPPTPKDWASETPADTVGEQVGLFGEVKDYGD